MVPQSPSMRERRRLRIRGIVQGVGFRPFVYEQALRCGLAGYVRNDSAGVTIEIEGERQALDMFQVMLMAQPPPLARIDALAVERLPLSGETAFAIAASVDGAARSALVTPDSATCEACRYELFNPADRRFRYPFINCTNCGPRFTIIEDIPYDRARTTMRSFAMCSACLREYKDPLDRRFHAQPNACPACGPQVCLIGQDGRRTAGDEAIRLAADRLAAGAILAIKGLGGYHLACDACNSAAVERLRLAKRREARPFAMMAPDTATVERICLLRPDERALLESHRRPIVLLQRRPDSPVALGVAPGMATLGVMLPYTPVHHLLLAALAEGRVSDVPPVLVMTSGNLSEEPIVIHDDDALSRLLPLADGVLTHNRAIHVRCDDSVVRYVAGGEQLNPARAWLCSRADRTRA
ncbi:MAG: hypothetical protein KatS3mg057_2807 [Herpetosiphonaceae bacterium]|nr:MAG: hypothetical protein KatS3mg057_2807 [Herpetosiphonaceae bacterium]